jgi:UDP-N-acetylmuramoylalanine--D-glutamate ligase
VSEFAGERALVIGFGVSGKAAASVLLAEGATVRASEARTREDLARVEREGELEEWGGPDLGREVEVLTGGHEPEHLDGATIVVVSPGVPESAPIIGWARERGLPVWGEVELGARLCRVPYVAVTGTNGKTTTTELVASVMRASGLSARACGNVGFPFSIAARGGFDALAVEVSSFQLASEESLHPKVSVLLNLAPDHLDWHGSFSAYAAAKARIFARQGAGDIHVGNRDDAAAAGLSRAAPCAVHWFGSGMPEAGGDAGVASGRLFARTSDGSGGPGEEFEVSAPVGAGRAVLMDAAAATAAALAFGLSPDAIVASVPEFVQRAHRGSVVATAGSVRFVDDSKATNPHAALAALEGGRHMVLIAGGLDKGVDLSPMSAAAPALTAVIAIGDAARKVARVFRGLVPVHMAGTIEEAVELGYRESPPDGTVILAPACASQDMFRDYKERGERFTAAARALAEGPRAHA